ncbi:flagellar basal body FlgE domain-containing protein [Shigella flexneri]
MRIAITKKASVTVFDSQGNAHDMSVYFVKSRAEQRQVYTQDSSDPNSIAKTATTLKFNANGTLWMVRWRTSQPAQLTAQNPPRLA